ncbi:MAG TPA: DNA repair helicase XPB [Spirochaetota bacterium]|nr:DNA repair helicase XPB [Spirochaetota bacterium]
MPHPDNPLIVQSDFSVLLEVNSPLFREVRDRISSFLELEKSPEMFYTYRLNAVSLWNGFASGLTDRTVINILNKYIKYPLPATVKYFIEEYYLNYGIFKLDKYDAKYLKVSCDDNELLQDISYARQIENYVYRRMEDYFLIKNETRGVFKLAMIYLNYPVDDRVGYLKFESYPIGLRRHNTFHIRNYQQEALKAFYNRHDPGGGAGVIVLPCGSGKTIVGLAAMAEYSTKTLIITPNIVALRQWRSELLDKTSLTEADIGEYSGECKEIKPVTITTYQILIYRKNKNEDFIHFNIFYRNNWGFIIYDEIHLLPAPVFKAIASIQAVRRLGLTATLVREDHKEKDVFSLVGPKKFDVPWKALESDAYIAEALCYEIRVPMSDAQLTEYFESSDRMKFRIASENRNKTDYLAYLLENLTGHNILIIGQYINQLSYIAAKFDLNLITGKTDNATRQDLYKKFRESRIRKLVVSKVANFAIDLPDADVAIQISGTFGSRQEEAQRLGRILRPKPGDNRAYFLNIITADSKEEFFAQNRKRFLMGQGYKYNVISGFQQLKELVPSIVTH